MIAQQEVRMALRSIFWSTNQRLQRAAENSPSMHAFEPDHKAVILLQQALANTGILPPSRWMASMASRPPARYAPWKFVSI
jgi:hypothetical protein